MSTSWETVDQAERRLEERAAQRARARERRSVRSRRRPMVLALAVLPVAGAAVLLALLELEGGDLGSWQRGWASAALAAAFAWPAAASALAARRRPLVERVAWPVVCVLAQVALTVGVGFVLLGLGPR